MNAAQYEAFLEAYDSLSDTMTSEGIPAVAASLGIDPEVFLSVCDQITSSYMKIVDPADEDDLRLCITAVARLSLALGLRHGSEPPFRVGAESAR